MVKSPCTLCKKQPPIIIFPPLFDCGHDVFLDLTKNVFILHTQQVMLMPNSSTLVPFYCANSYSLPRPFAEVFFKSFQPCAGLNSSWHIFAVLWSCQCWYRDWNIRNWVLIQICFMHMMQQDAHHFMTFILCFFYAFSTDILPIKQL